MGEINKIGIVGAGMMGAEIALCFAISGHEVIMKDASIELAQKGKTLLGVLLDRKIQKGGFPAYEKDSVLSRIQPTEEYDALKEVDLIIEAVFEDLKVKGDVFAQLDSLCKPDCIFATNTSSIPITLLATSVNSERKTRFLGTHFFSPASVKVRFSVEPE